MLSKRHCAARVDGHIVGIWKSVDNIRVLLVTFQNKRGIVSFSNCQRCVITKVLRLTLNSPICSTDISFVPDLFFGILNWIGTVVDHEQSLCDGNTFHSRVRLSAVHRQLVLKPQSPGWICDFSERKVNMTFLTSHLLCKLLRRPFLAFDRLINWMFL